MIKSIFSTTLKIIGILALVAIILVAILKLLPASQIPQPGKSNNAYPPPANTPTRTFTPRPYPPPGKNGLETASPTLTPYPIPSIPPPPEGLPTDQSWPPSRESTRQLDPTRTPVFYPTPAFRSSPVGKAASNLQALWYPYYPDSISLPRLQTEQIDALAQRWGKGPTTIDVQLGPGFRGSTLAGLFPSPDGKWMAAITNSGEASQSYLIDLSTGKADLLIPNIPNVKFLGWEPDSLKVIAQLEPMEPASVSEVDILSGDHHKLEFPKANGVVPYSVKAIAFSPDGSSMADALVYQPWAGYSENCIISIGIRDVKTQARKIIKDISSGCTLSPFSLKWSDDGQYLSWVAMETLKGEPPFGRDQAELWVRNNSSGEAKPLTVLAENVEGVSAAEWSPDSKNLAFIKYDKSDVKNSIGNIVMIDPNSGAQTQISHFSNRFVSNLVWSPNGQWIFCSVYDDSSGAIWAVSIDGSASFPVAGPILAKSAFALLP